MLRRSAWFAVSLLAACAWAPATRAAEFYANGTFMQSLGRDNSSGEIDLIDGFEVVGSDGDSSLAYGLGIGFGFDFDEVLPKKWSSWGTAFRVESEFVYGREYDFVSNTELDGEPTSEHFFNEVKAWTLMPVNLYIDVPLRRPLSKIFGRVPRLEPFALSVGFGAGISHVHINAFDNVAHAVDSVYKFSFQGNAALSYEINERTRLQFGYRYLDLGATDAQLRFNGTDPPDNEAGVVDLDLYSHEFVLAVRWGFHQKPLAEMEFPWPDSMPRWLGGEGGEKQPQKPPKPKKKRRWFKRPSWLGGEKEL
jgi:opacity protein-like surface antigen